MVDTVRVTQSSSASLVFRMVRFFFRAGGWRAGLEADVGTVGVGVGWEWEGWRRVWEEGRERREGVVGIEGEG